MYGRSLADICAKTWLNTPDNRQGFASYFLSRGYVVYIVDQTSVGRGSDQDFNGYPLRIGSTVEINEEGFTYPEGTNAYPQSQLHTQWPGVSASCTLSAHCPCASTKCANSCWNGYRPGDAATPSSTFSLRPSSPSRVVIPAKSSLCAPLAAFSSPKLEKRS